MTSSTLQNGDPYLGLLSFLSFTFSVIAAVLAIDMYTLLRTGEFGKTWRVIIIASVMFALMQALRMAETLDWYIALHGLSQIVELMFAMSLAYAFYLQRKAFTQAARLRGLDDERRGEARAVARRPGDRDEPAINADAAPVEDDEARVGNQGIAPPPALHDNAEIEWEPQTPVA